MFAKGSPSPNRRRTPPQRSQTHPDSGGLLTVQEDNARRFSTGNIETTQSTKPLTLLEQTELFRKKYSKKWRDQQQKRQQRAEELLGKAKAGSFVRRYNEKAADERKQSLQEEQRRKQEPRKIIVYIHSCRPGTSDRVYKEMATSSEGTEGRECSVFQFQTNQGRRNADDVFDLLVTVSTALNMHNGVSKDEDRMEKCRVKLFVFPDHGKRETVRRSSFRFLTLAGTTKLDHSFIIKGASRSDLLQRYFVLEVEGQNSYKKAILGQALICGDDAKIKSKSQQRYGVENEKQLLSKALDKPNTDHSVTFDLTEADENTEISLGTRLMRDLALDKAQKKNILRKGAMKGVSPTPERRASIMPDWT